MLEKIGIAGVYYVECRNSAGVVKWTDKFDNEVVSIGRAFALDVFLSGDNYSVTGPFCGLIGSTNFVSISAGDTMASHGWTEYAGYSGSRKTCVWSAAVGGSKSLSAALSFNFNAGPAIIKGAFMVFGPGAVNTISDPNGVLYSAGLLTSGDRSIDTGDVISLSYVAIL